MGFAYRVMALVCLAVLGITSPATAEVKFKNPGVIRLTADFGTPFKQELVQLLTEPDQTGIAWTQVDMPAWLTLNPTTGTLQGNPPASALGVKPFLISAVKNELGDILHPFEIEVRAIPKWDTQLLDLGTAREDFLFTFDLRPHVTNPLGGMMTFSAAGLPAWLMLDAATGTLSGTPRRTDVGPFTGVTFTASTQGGSAQVPAQGLVQKTIHPPHWRNNPIALESATDDAPYSRNVAEFAVNPEGTELTISKVGGAAWATVDADGTIHGSPAKSDVGNASVAVRLSTTIDGQAFQDDTIFTIVVVHVKKPPVWPSQDIDLGKAREDSVFTFDLRPLVTDPEGGTVTFTGAGLPAWLKLTPAGVLSGTPKRADVGPFAGVTFTATASGGSSQVTARGEVLKTIKPPRWQANPITLASALEESPYLKDASALVVNPEGTALTFDKVSGSGWLELSPTGLLSGTPHAPDVGPAAIVAHFTTTIDGQVFEDTTTLQLTVVHVKKPPVWASQEIDLGKAKEDSAFTFDLKTVVTDPEGGTITFSATGFPAWLKLTPAGVLSGTPKRADVGPFAGIRFTATASGGSSQAGGHGEVLKTIHPPKWTANPIALPDAKEDVAYLRDVTVFVSNPEGTALTFDKVSGPAWVSLLPSGLLSGTPHRPDAGPVQITAHFVTTIDGQTFEDTTTFVFNVKKTIHPPKWMANPVILADAPDGAAYLQELSKFVLNPEGTALTYDLLPSPIPPAWISVQASTGLLFGVPQKENVGNVTLRAHFTTFIEGQAYEDTTTVQFKVTHVGKPPQWTQDPIDLGTQPEGKAFTFDLKPKVTNPEGGSLVFTATGLPAWLALDPSGTLSGTPRRADVGNYTGIVFTATGTGGAAIAKGFGEVIKVIQPPKWKASPIALADTKVEVPYLKDVTPFVVNPEGAVLSYALVSGPAWLSLSPTGILSGTAHPADIGPVSAVARLSGTIDGVVYEDTTTFTFKVLAPVVHPPKWVSNPIRIEDAKEAVAYSKALAGYVLNPDGMPLTFDLAATTMPPAWLTVGSASGILSGTPQADDVGSVAIDVHFTATYLGQTYEDTTTILFNVVAKGKPPIWNTNPIPMIAIAEKPFSASLVPFATDPGGLTLTFSRVTGPGWLSVSVNGGIAGTPQLSDVGEQTWRVRACNTLPLCADATLIITVKKEPPTQIDTVQVDADVPNAVIENLWIIGNNAYASKLMKALKGAIHLYYEDLAAANVWSAGVLISADGGKKGAPIRQENGPWLLTSGPLVAADHQARTDLAFTPGIFTKRFNSPIWSMFQLYLQLPTMPHIYHAGWFEPQMPMEALIVTANRDHFLCYSKKTPQENWDANDFANYFIDAHHREAKPYRISAITPECPSFTEVSCDESTATAEGTYQVLVRKTGGKHYPIECGCGGIELEAVMHDYAKESIFRARVAAHRVIPLTKVPLDPQGIKLTIAGVAIAQGEKWTYDEESNSVLIRWELIDEVKLEPGDTVTLTYKVAAR